MTQLASSFDQLAQMSIFAGLSDEQRRQIVEIATTVEFSPGETILRQGDSGRNLWIVVEGQCEVTRAVTHQGSNGQDCGNDGDDAIVLAELGPYSQFGEMSFFHAAPHSASVKAKTPVTLLRVEKQQFDRLVEDQCWAAYMLAENIIHQLAERLRRMDEWVADLLAEETPQAAAPKEQVVAEWHSFREKLFDEWTL